jgi:hypothetical protein
MPTVTLPGGYETAEPGRPAPNGEDIMPFDGGVISIPGNPSRRASRTVTVVESTRHESFTPQSGPDKSTC